MSIFKVNSVVGGTEYEFSLSKYIHGFLENRMNGTGAYWYLYCYLGILFVLPLLQRMAKEVTKIGGYSFTGIAFYYFIVFSNAKHIFD